MLLDIPTTGFEKELYRHPFWKTLKAPKRVNMFQELRGVEELYKLWQARKLLPPLKSDEPETILVIPGLYCFDFLTFMTRFQLNRAGHSAYGWRMGINWGNTDKDVPILVEKISGLVEKYGRPVVLLGWSLGGVMAREIARQYPSLIKMVLTFGAPIIGGAKYTIVDYWYRLQKIDLDQQELDLMSQFQVPIQQPIVAYYSKNDNVVDWRACIDPYSPHVEHVEVDSTHFGMGFSADIIQHMLAQLQSRATKPAAQIVPNYVHSNP
ncbi:MAG: alpha/beta hydrolase [Chloroflexota bacterium]